MVASNSYETGLTPDGSLWLEVRQAGRVHVFCCARDDERAIVLGSLPRADIHVAALGMAPVHLHFEREGALLLLAPSYHAEVRVNSMLARGPVALPAHAIVEFSGLRIEVLVHSTRPKSADTPSPDIPERESGIAYIAALPTDTQTTKLALEAYPRVDNVQGGIETSENLVDINHEALRTQRIVRGEPDYQTTQVMERLQVVTDAIPVQAQQTMRMERVSPEAFRFPTVEVTPVIETRRLKPVEVAAAAPKQDISAPPPPEVPSSPAALGWQETTAFDLESLRSELAPTPLPAAKVATAPTPRPPSPPAPATTSAPMSGKSSPPPARSVRARPGVLGRALMRLGEHAKARPAAVAGAGLCISIALALTLVGLTQVVGGGRSALATPHPSAGSASMPAHTEPPTSSAAVQPEATAPTPSTSTAVAIAADAPKPLTSQRAPSPTASPMALAAAHLVAGRYVEARAAYAALSASHPENLAYQSMSRLLERRTGPSCNGLGASSSCPEIVP